MRFVTARAWATLLLVATSCAPITRSYTVEFASPEGYVAHIPLHTAPNSPLSDEAQSPARERLPSPLSIEGALRYAWAHHPRMQQLRLEWKAADGDGVQVGLRPNPQAALSYRDEFDEKDVFALTLSQRIEFGGKRRARVAAANAKRDAARVRTASEWAEIRARVLIALVEFTYAAEQRPLIEQLAGFRREALLLTEGLLDAGKTSRVDLLDAREQAALARAALAEADIRLSHAERIVLLATGAHALGDSDALQCEFSMKDFSDPKKSYDELLALSKERSPILSMARARSTLLDARRDLARTLATPNGTLSAGGGSIRSDSGDSHDELHVTLSGDVPLFDRNQGEVEASEYRYRASLEEKRSAHLDVESMLSALVAELDSTRTTINAFNETVMPSAVERLDYARGQVAADRLSRHGLLEQEIELVDLQLKYLKAKRAMARAAVQLEQISGVLLLGVEDQSPDATIP